MRLALPVLAISQALCGAAGYGQATSRAVGAIAELVRTGGGDTEALARLCEEDPERARMALREYLATHESIPTYDAARVLHALKRFLGTREALSFAKHMFLNARDPKDIRTWFRAVQHHMEAPWSWFYEVRLATDSDDAQRVELLDLHLAGSPPASVEELSALQPETAKALLLRAQGYGRLAYVMRRRGHDEDARAYSELALMDAEAALRLEPRSVDALYAVAARKSGLGQYEEALPLLNQVIEGDPEHIRAHRTRAWAHRNLGHTAEAEANTARAEELEAAAEAREAAAREAHLRSAEGLEQLSRSADSGLRQALLMGGRGEAERYADMASERLDELLHYHPDQALFRLKRGMFRHHLGQAAEALADYEAYVAVTDDAPYVHYLRAKALTALGREEEAAQALVSYERGIAAFGAPTLALELPAPERPTLGLDHWDVVGLADAAEQNTETLARVLVDAGTDGPTWAKAIFALRELDDEQLVPLAPYLEQATLVGEQHYPGRLTLLSLLRRAGQASSIPYLLHAATDARPEAYSWRRRAVEALGELPRELAEPALQRLALASVDPEVVELASSELLGLSRGTYRQFWLRVILGARRQYQIRAAGQFSREPLSLLMLLQTARDEEAEPAAREQAAEVLWKRWSAVAEWAVPDLGRE